MKKTEQKSNMLPEERKKLAEAIKAAFDAVSPFIEKHTAIVCPDCTDLCCKDKHARYDDYDIIFMKALGEYIPQDHAGRAESDSCRFINETGCILERWERPYRCTNFFCTPLLESLESDNALYRAFRHYLEELGILRRQLLE